MKSLKQYLLLVAVGIHSLVSFAQAPGSGSSSAPELVFKNPVLKSGLANKEGAVYRFANVAPGVDAEIKLKKFSTTAIVMQSMDLASMGWDKAFQPQFGLPGLVGPNKNWYIDFELVFYKAGQNMRQRMDKVVLTTLDVDGDGNSISEYAVLNNPSAVAYSTVTYLQGLTSAAANVGQSFTCGTCSLPSLLITCGACNGTGITSSGSGNDNDCDACDGSGKKQAICGHPYTAPATVQGPVENFLNIDTLATQVMATYTYLNRDRISFRYGAKSGNLSSNGSGIRLNSMWFKSFDLAATGTLPVRLTNFTATYDKKNATLSWTGHEENFSHYVLQRSTDGKTFSDIAIIFANGNGEANYRYKDLNVTSPSGSVFYRLELVDNAKEAAKYSEIRVIRLSKDPASFQITTYPNPVTDQLRVTLPATWQGKPVMIELISANGTRMQSMQLGSASQTETLQLGKISKGFYIVKAVCEEQVAEQRVFKN